ncbi:hypothetical protein BHE74_00049700 [Ensete ventricosum]|nr:hypothetical protein BHE74_00049700 [Ensete ventricosum]RZS04150.1 hypothetical protein BHM03_00034440 [Ensete ventricosum]
MSIAALHLLLRSAPAPATALAAAFVVGILLLARRRRSNSPPGRCRLSALKDKKPHLTFAKWAAKYGPIYTIRTGTSTVVVLNSTELAKEVHTFSCSACCCIPSFALMSKSLPPPPLLLSSSGR